MRAGFGAALLLAAGLVVAAAGGGTAARVAVTVTPRSATFDVPFDVQVTGLRPRQSVTLSFSGRSPDGELWQGQRPARADRNGVVALGDAYLLSRMRHRGSGLLPALPRRVTVVVRGAGVDVSASARRYSVSTVSFPRTFESPKRVGFYGYWDRPRGVGDRTAVLLMGGSAGGLSDATLAATLVAHGYPVLELAYFREPGLPPLLKRIRLEYFQRALRWLASRPEVDPERIVTFGISYGGPLSLLLGSTFPTLVHGAVGYVPSFQAAPSPSDYDAPAWTYRGRPVMGETIPVWKTSGPVFVAGGNLDRVWESGLSVQIIAEEMHQHGRRDLVALDYPNAGHELGAVLPLPRPAEKPYGVWRSKLYGTLYMGGSPRADAAAREDAWPKLLRFLARIGR